MTRRQVIPLTLPSTLLDEISARAAREGRSAAAVVDELLIDELPKMVAEAVRRELLAEMQDDPCQQRDGGPE